MSEARMISLVLALSWMLLGCSPARTIATQATNIRTLAESSKDRFQRIDNAARADPPRAEEIIEESDQGLSEQTQIIEATSIVVESVSQVEDKVPWWASMIQTVAIAAIVVAVLIGLWYTGIGTLLRKVLGFIPEAKKEEAKLLDESLEDPKKLKEAVAAMRAKDPLLNEAFKKRRK